MKLHRIKIKNFRNFKDLDVMLGDQVVIVGENKIGKTNLLHALRLVLDPSLPDSARQLQQTDFWDGLGEQRTEEDAIEVAVEFSDFDEDEDLLAVLAEHIVQAEPMVARLTYVFRPKSTLSEEPKSLADYEFSVYGGDRQENTVGHYGRSRIPLDVLHALRDAERDLASWTRSPLRPLLDEAGKDIDKEELKVIAERIKKTSETVLDLPEARSRAPAADATAKAVEDGKAGAPETAEDELEGKPIRKLAFDIASRLEDMVGTSQALETMLGFSTTDPDRLIRSIRLLIDGGRRNVSDASLGSANLLYLTLKSLELDQLAASGQRDHTFLAIEEPEAHLHPHLQRLIYRDFLRRRPHQETTDEEEASSRGHQTTILTTHSPHIVSVAPLRSIVLLKHSIDHTVGVSSARVALSPEEVDDIERYLDVNRGELLFARAVILVEGPAEEYLLPVFAQTLDNRFDFDELGISVCSVAGTNFLPYVRLLGKSGFGIRSAILTDSDPKEGGGSLGRLRVLKILEELMEPREFARLSPEERLTRAPEFGVFINNHTLELDLWDSGCHTSMCRTLIELTDNSAARVRAENWLQAPGTLDKERFLKDIEDVGKGRYAQRLASHIDAGCCPRYIKEAIQYVARP